MSEDLYTRLRSELWRLDQSTGGCGNMLGAIEAVVELHKPVETWCDSRTNEEGEWEQRAFKQDGKVIALDGVELACFADKIPQDWPCPTLLAIAEALGLSSGTEGDPRDA